MPRLPQITDKADLAGEHHAIFDAIAESRGRVGFPFSLLLHSPEAAGRIAHLGHHLRFETELTPMQREVAILCAARESDCEFEFAAHARLGLQAGVRQEAIDAIANRAALDAFTDDERFVVRYARELLLEHRVSTETFDGARSRLGDRALVDLTALLGYYTMLACALNAFEATPPADWAGLPR